MCDFSSFYLSYVSVDYSSDVLAHSTAAVDCFFDVATINAACTFVWTTLAIAAYMVFFALTHDACFNHTTIVVLFTGYSPSCNTNSTSYSYNDYTFGSRHHCCAHRSTGLYYSHSTNCSNYMAHYSSSISRIDHTTYTFAELTVSTSYPSFSTTGSYSYSSPSRTSTSCSQGRPEASI